MGRLSWRAAGQLTGLRSIALPRQGWVCSSCRSVQSRGRGVRLLSSDAPKPYYVTTPIFYVNASPHIGHMYSMVIGDVLKRWQVLKGNKALLCTGTDEHGMKIQQAAALDDMPPKEFCDVNAANFKNLAQLSEIDYDFFIRTTDEDHAEAVKHFWFLLQEKGYIYESKHEGWYCVSDEIFYSESEIEKRVDPMTGKVHMASIQSGHPVEWIEEKNYHFRMSDLKAKLLDFYAKNPDWITPASKMNEVTQWVRNNLEDLSISRPVSRLNWGIPVPGDPSQTIYVWLDALINYITKAGFPNWSPGHEREGGWPADMHVIGKDILRFHCVYWPALLLALDLPLPRRILCHAHWTLGRKKMSKSRGNVVNPFFAIDRFGVDAMRFYLVHDSSAAHDSDYGNLNIIDRHKKSLQRGIGNLLSRLTRAKQWNVAEVVREAHKGRLGAVGSDEENGAGKDDASLPTRLAAQVSQHMDGTNPFSALREITDAVAATNRNFQDAEPWQLMKSEEERDRLLGLRSVFLAAESLRTIGILLQPFMPTKAGQLLDILGVAKSRRDYVHAKLAADPEYGTPMAEPGTGRHDALFPPLEVQE